MKRIFDEEAAVREAELREIESMERGIREGKDLRDSEIVLNMYAEDISTEPIVKLTKIPLEKVKKIIESITK